MTRRSNLAYHAKYSDAAKAMPDITVYVLQASRSIRIVWLLEELGLDYKVVFANRVNQKAPQDFKDDSGNPLGKFPTLKDGDLTIYESGAITDKEYCVNVIGEYLNYGPMSQRAYRYLCDKYDTANKIIPKDAYSRSQVLTFIHAAEGTLMIHALAILYARWSVPEEFKSNAAGMDKMEEALSPNVQRDLDWLSQELSSSTGQFLVGNTVTAADCMMHMSARFIFARELGTRGKKWPKIEEWLDRCENTSTYKKAVEKSGHTFFPDTT